MARPREFDRDEVLARAVKVFASHGFGGTSTVVLLKGMKISRQSMYDTFGDKRHLYLEALRRYSSDSTANVIGAMHSHDSALQGVETALRSVVARPANEACLGVSATMEFGRSDRDVAAITDAAGATIMAAFERVVRTGQREKEFSAHVDPRAAAMFLASVLAGLKVTARSGATRETLRNVVDMALQSLL
ncbi:MAG: TetR family transcriptional regulator [Gemmatimonadetes bacterium]|nr:TetR family transcriptional regulator [Gemmatimonadota bacterium]